MNNQTVSLLKYILVLLIAGIFASKFLGAYNTLVRNAGIDGCYNQSFYRVERKEGDKMITTSETQKYLYDKCLLDKNIK